MPLAQKVAYYMKKMQRVSGSYAQKADRVVSHSIDNAWRQTIKEMGCQTARVFNGMRRRWYK